MKKEIIAFLTGLRLAVITVLLLSSGLCLCYRNVSASTTKSDGVYTYNVELLSVNQDSAMSFSGIGKISSLTNTSNGIKIKWSKVSQADGYYIYRKTSTGSYKKIKTITSASTVSYTDTKIKNKNGKMYIYKVVPYSEGVKGTGVEKQTVRLTGTTLTDVSNASSKKITVKWTKSTGITGYQIQYSTSSSFSDGNVKKNVAGASTVMKTISGMAQKCTYYVRIRTYVRVGNNTYYSAWSARKKVETSYTLSEVAGTWEIDSALTMTINGIGMTMIYGTAYRYGNQMVIGSSGTFQYYVGAGIGGKGSCKLRGTELSYSIVPYEGSSSESGTLTIDTESADGMRLVMQYFGYSIYWMKE